MMKLNRNIRDQIVVASLSAALGAVTLATLKRPEEAKAAEIIADQRTQIERLTDDLQCSGEFTRIDDVEDDSADEPEKEGCVSRETYEHCLNDLYSDRSAMCQTGMDTVEAAKNHRNSCDVALELNQHIGRSYYFCEKAEESAPSAEEKKNIRKAMDSYEELQKNHHISPRQCPDLPKLNKHD
jgi:hypothetical protein